MKQTRKGTDCLIRTTSSFLKSSIRLITNKLKADTLSVQSFLESIMHRIMIFLLLVQIVFTVIRADDFDCIWDQITQEVTGAVICSTKGVGNFLDISGAQNGLCLADVSLNVLRGCYIEAGAICEPYRAIAGETCYLDCSRYHTNCCCGDLLASPTAAPNNPTAKPTRAPTKPPTLKPTPSRKPSMRPSASPTEPPSISPKPTPFPTVSREPSAAPTSKPSASPTITLLPSVVPTLSQTPTKKACPWEKYSNARCSDMNVSLGDGDCKFNPGNTDAICALQVITKCKQFMYAIDWQCRQLCRNFHKECCCGVMKPDS